VATVVRAGAASTVDEADVGGAVVGGPVAAVTSVVGALFVVEVIVAMLEAVVVMRALFRSLLLALLLVKASWTTLARSTPRVQRSMDRWDDKAVFSVTYQRPARPPPAAGGRGATRRVL
jgi:hypothetical protein